MKKIVCDAIFYAFIIFILSTIIPIDLNGYVDPNDCKKVRFASCVEVVNGDTVVTGYTSWCVPGQDRCIAGAPCWD